MQKPIKFLYAALIITIIGGGFTLWIINLTKDEATNELSQIQDTSNDNTDIVVLEKDSQGRPTQQMHKIAGGSLFGAPVEYVYYGNLQAGKAVRIVYISEPGDGFLTITGAVNQVIDAEDFPEGDNFNELVDLSSGSNVVYLDTDYNFDGYNDLASVSSAGSQVTSYNIFLYDTKLQKFVYNPELSKLQNIQIDSDKKLIQEFIHYPADPKADILIGTDIMNDYKWLNGHLVEVKD